MLAGGGKVEETQHTAAIPPIETDTLDRYIRYRYIFKSHIMQRVKDNS